ncbi:MAG: lpxL, partial [Gammaproteobacteria bacterium]|nr:lpxL [Gammaproteobacteria bacterium]
LDEYKNGKVWGPRFGRKFSEPTNLDYVLRLAIKFNAVLLPIYLTRLEGVNFQMHVSPPVSPDTLQDHAGVARVRQDLENWSESTIRTHIDQWYMLHHFRF